MLSKNQIKFIRSLKSKKQRSIHQLFVVEGSRMVLELMESNPDELAQLIVTTDYLEKNEIPPHFKYDLTDSITFKKLTNTVSPQGIMALFNQPKMAYQEQDFMLFLDNIQDPGNMGTIIRLADWFGVKQLVCSLDCVDVFNPKVIQSSMGSIYRVPVHYLDLQDTLRQINLPVYGAYLDGENVYSQVLEPKGVLIMGNEGNGIRPELTQFISQKIMIPRFGNGESLNVSTATGILLSEFRRTTPI